MAAFLNFIYYETTCSVLTMTFCLRIFIGILNDISVFQIIKNMNMTKEVLLFNVLTIYSYYEAVSDSNEEIKRHI
jgi:hypothetical protein